RLPRRGVALGAAGLAAAALAEGAAPAAVSPALAASTARAALAFVAGGTAAGAVPAGVIALAEGVSRAMIVTKLRIVVVALLGARALACGLGSGVLDAQEKQVPKPPLRREGSAGEVKA